MGLLIGGQQNEFEILIKGVEQGIIGITRKPRNRINGPKSKSTQCEGACEVHTCRESLGRETFNKILEGQ